MADKTAMIPETKEEILLKLKEKKKELAKKQRKLEKFQRASRLKEHRQQKIREHQELEHASECVTVVTKLSQQSVIFSNEYSHKKNNADLSNILPEIQKFSETETKNYRKSKLNHADILKGHSVTCSTDDLQENQPIIYNSIAKKCDKMNVELPKIINSEDACQSDCSQAKRVSHKRLSLGNNSDSKRQCIHEVKSNLEKNMSSEVVNTISSIPFADQHESRTELVTHKPDRPVLSFTSINGLNLPGSVYGKFEKRKHESRSEQDVRVVQKSSCEKFSVNHGKQSICSDKQIDNNRSRYNSQVLMEAPPIHLQSPVRNLHLSGNNMSGSGRHLWLHADKTNTVPTLQKQRNSSKPQKHTHEKLVKVMKIGQSSSPGNEKENTLQPDIVITVSKDDNSLNDPVLKSSKATVINDVHINNKEGVKKMLDQQFPIGHSKSSKYDINDEICKGKSVNKELTSSEVVSAAVNTKLSTGKDKLIDSDDDVVVASQTMGVNSVVKRTKPCLPAPGQHIHRSSTSDWEQRLDTDLSQMISPSFKSLTSTCHIVRENVGDTNYLLNHAQSLVTDSEFLNILGVSQASTSWCQTFDGRKGTQQAILPLENKELRLSEMNSTISKINSQECKIKELCKTFHPHGDQSEKSKLSLKTAKSSPTFPICKGTPQRTCASYEQNERTCLKTNYKENTCENIADFLTTVPDSEPLTEFTELDAIPYSQFELTEDFLSESSLSQPHSIQSREKLSTRRKSLIKRCSPRLTSCTFASMDKSSDFSQVSDVDKFLDQMKGKRRSGAQQRMAAAVLSIFQYLNDEAKKVTTHNDFELPCLYDTLKEKSSVIKDLNVCVDSVSLQQTTAKRLNGMISEMLEELPLGSAQLANGEPCTENKTVSKRHKKPLEKKYEEADKRSGTCSSLAQHYIDGQSGHTLYSHTVRKNSCEYEETCCVQEDPAKTPVPIHSGMLVKDSIAVVEWDCANEQAANKMSQISHIKSPLLNGSKFDVNSNPHKELDVKGETMLDMTCSIKDTHGTASKSNLNVRTLTVQDPSSVSTTQKELDVIGEIIIDRTCGIKDIQCTVSKSNLSVTIPCVQDSPSVSTPESSKHKPKHGLNRRLFNLSQNKSLTLIDKESDKNIHDSVVLPTSPTDDRQKCTLHVQEHEMTDKKSIVKSGTPSKAYCDKDGPDQSNLLFSPNPTQRDYNEGCILSPDTPIMGTPCSEMRSVWNPRRSFSFTSTPKTTRNPCSDGELIEDFRFESPLRNVQNDSKCDFPQEDVEHDETCAPHQSGIQNNLTFQKCDSSFKGNENISSVQLESQEQAKPTVNSTPTPVSKSETIGAFTVNRSHLSHLEECHISSAQVPSNIPHNQSNVSISNIDEPTHLEISQINRTRNTEYISPWKRISKTSTTPLQVLEEEKGQQGLSGSPVFTPSRRSGARSKCDGAMRDGITSCNNKLKFSGCFQPCSNDSVVSLHCGKVLLSQGRVQPFMVSVQATALTIWSQDNQWDEGNRWTIELDWRLSKETHIMKSELLPCTNCVVLLVSGVHGKQTFANVFVYHWETDETTRIKIPLAEEYDKLRCPAQIILCVASTTEFLLGVTSDSFYAIRKVELSETKTAVSNSRLFDLSRGHLSSLVTVVAQPSAASLTLTRGQRLTLWNTNLGVALRTYPLPRLLPCFSGLVAASTLNGYIFMDVTLKSELGDTGAKVGLNPMSGTFQQVYTYSPPNNLWKRFESVKRDEDYVVAVSDCGAIAIWNGHIGRLQGHSRSTFSTCAAVMRSSPTGQATGFAVGEIHGCVHLYMAQF